MSCYITYIPLISRVFGPYCKLRTELCYITCVMLRDINVMLCYITCVMLGYITYVMLLCFITSVMLCYITCVMLCFIIYILRNTHQKAMS